jgi:hypothetical protein
VSRPSPLASTLIVIVLTLTLALAGCSGFGTYPHLSQLHAPHLHDLSALTSVLETSGYFSIAAVFEQHGNSEPQVISFHHNDLEVTGLDGHGDRLIPTDGSCEGNAAVSPDGLWAACVLWSYPASKTAPATYQLDVVSLSPHGPPVHHAIALGDTESILWPVWSPDGRYLAVGVGCGVEIFTASPEGSPPVMVGSFTSSALIAFPSCVASGLSWSPDSTQLRLGAPFQPVANPPYLVDDHISLAQVLAGKGTTVQIPATDFTPFLAGEVRLGPAWRPGENTALMMVNGTNGLLYYTGAGQPPQVLLTMPDGAHQVQSALWTPDGRQLVLTIGTGPCVDHCTYIIPDVYLLTPMLST